MYGFWEHHSVHNMKELDMMLGSLLEDIEHLSEESVFYLNKQL